MKLTYAAYTTCVCGAGMAYRKGDKAWDCSDILRNKAIQAGKEGAVQHNDLMPFVFWEILSEDQPSAQGATTRPEDDPRD